MSSKQQTTSPQQQDVQGTGWSMPTFEGLSNAFIQQLTKAGVDPAELAEQVAGPVTTAR